MYLTFKIVTASADITSSALSHQLTTILVERCTHVSYGICIEKHSKRILKTAKIRISDQRAPLKSDVCFPVYHSNKVSN